MDVVKGVKLSQVAYFHAIFNYYGFRGYCSDFISASVTVAFTHRIGCKGAVSSMVVVLHTTDVKTSKNKGILHYFLNAINITY